MSNTTFTIDKKEIFKCVLATSAYTTRSREAMGIPQAIGERMLVTDDDRNIIHKLIDSSMDEVHADIVRYHPGSSVTTTGEQYTFNLTTPANYPAANGEKLARSIKDYASNRALQHWYTDIKPDEANIAATKAQSNAIVIRQLLSQREKPLMNSF